MSSMNTDPLFERRELTRVISVPSKYLQKNVRGSLLGQLSAHVEGKCGIEGFIQHKSSVILEHSLGKIDMLHSGIQYRVRFHADVCFPHKGQIFKAPVLFKSKIGIHAEIPPMRILLSRDLHIGNAEFDALQEKDEVFIEVQGTEFKQNDDTIFVLGRFLQKDGVAAPEVPVEAPAEEIPPLVPIAPEGDVKTVAVKPATAEAPAAAAPRRRKRLQAPTSLQLNVDSSESKEGKAEGESREAVGV